MSLFSIYRSNAFSLEEFEGIIRRELIGNVTITLASDTVTGTRLGVTFWPMNSDKRASYWADSNQLLHITSSKLLAEMFLNAIKGMLLASPDDRPSLKLTQ